MQLEALMHFFGLYFTNPKSFYFQIGMKGYIDVFNPNANPNPAGSQNPPGVPMQPNHQQQGGPSLPVPNLFIPPSMPGDSGGDSGPVSFLTAPPVTDDVPGQEVGLHTQLCNCNNT